MVDFFSSIFEFFFHVSSYFVHLFGGLVGVISFLASGFTGVNYIIGIVPSFISSALICFFGINIVKFVFGGWNK